MANFEFINRNGVILADTSTIRDQVNSEYRQVFGEDFIIDPQTPQGTLIAGEITSRQSVSRNDAMLANQINPSQSEGVFLDAVYALFGGARLGETRSAVICVCTGVAGTVIPSGSRAQDGENQFWRSTAPATIGSNGSVNVNFEAVEFGPIAASPNTITGIVDNSVLGWETVNNAEAASQGRNRQSDSEARLSRTAQINLQSRSTPQAVQSRLTTISGYGSHQFRENVSDQTQVIDGITLLSHSIWVVVSGGGDNDIAESLSLSKSDGANFNGAVSVAVTDPFSGQSSIVRFDRPVDVPLAIRVTVRASTGADIREEVRQAVLDYASGNVAGERGFVVGVDATPFEIAAAVNSQVSGVFVRSVEMSENPGSPSYETDPIDIEINEIPTIEASAIEVVLL